MRSSFSKLKKKLKHPLEGNKRKSDRTGSHADGERAGLSDSSSQLGPHVVAGGGHDQEGRSADTIGRQVHSEGRPPQPEPEHMSVAGNENEQEGGEAKVDGGEVNRRNSRLHPDVEVTMESGRSEGDGRVHVPPSTTPPIPHSIGETDGTRT